MILSQVWRIVVKNFWENSVHYKSGSSIAHWRVAWIFHLKNPIAREWFVRQSLFSPDWIAHSWGIWDPCHSHCFGLLSSDRDNLVNQPMVIQNGCDIEKERKRHSDVENPHFIPPFASSFYLSNHIEEDPNRVSPTDSVAKPKSVARGLAHRFEIKTNSNIIWYLE